MTDNDLDLPIYHHTECGWNDEKAEDGYLVREIETTSHYVAVVNSDGYVEHLFDFEYRTRHDVCDDPDDAEEDEAEPPWQPLRKLIPRLDRLAYIVVVRRTEKQWIEAMDFGGELTPTGRSWPDEITYDTEILLPDRR